MSDVKSHFFQRNSKFTSRTTLITQRVLCTANLQTQTLESKTPLISSNPTFQKKKINLSAKIIQNINQVNQKEWDALVSSQEEFNPFVSWDFLNVLETSQSACGARGWLPQHIVVRNDKGELQGCCPIYLKTHSYGEYVFDRAWANVAHRMNQKYYPKLQSCVPFTPVTGPRMMIADSSDKVVVQKAIVKSLEMIATELGMSSVHVTFNPKEESRNMQRNGWMNRYGIQYHWNNNNYTDFDDFLMSLKSNKRKSIRQERKSIGKQGLDVRVLVGDEIKSHHWDAFYTFYLDTSDRKWGSAYLTRDFFANLGDALGDKVVLVVAYERNELVAGALNLKGDKALFGRNWGCRYGSMYKNLHFEVCYYKAIEFAIEQGLQRVEAGAQGEHKIQRGYVPTITHSSHFIADPTLRSVIQRYLNSERLDIQWTMNVLKQESSPYKNAN
eukprot:TRINITY_DN8274_c0_g1_i1.p1 TRINITY_DN8274_c0_g1~~TRINITY_DN8274_c0_g1_i1.p1  ORF type:complete len:458 (-),score=28.36 TRINITY_DN8274_c0_g1_i1:179-1504(-)